ncbi:hypothetical protein IW261DRAFT_1367867 [Armillaria novae-zelandiae]|uniref:Heterokaryon incompatibility domain-containing protein n=1 Tax=Armillaria novae-zelandiae TaxID=153914 RepID=A0AA39UF91_9AGAR|nr:hypothetical protein IW261DRAFT_1367867 [Armillaria novae-zelandiae]
MDDSNSTLSPEELLFQTVQSFRDDTRQQAKRVGLLKCLREVTLFADTEIDQAASSIQVPMQVPMQRTYTCTTYPVLPRYDADRLCADLGATELLIKLNRILGTSQRNTRSRSSLFDAHILMGYDFGTALGHLRPFWCEDIGTIIANLQICQMEDQEMRQKALPDTRIINPKMPPRRVWDLYSNRVVPYWVIQGSKRLWAISHAWMDENDRSDVSTPINGYEWPVPIPKGANLDLIRIEMLNLGAEYVWLDVLCLRQKGGQREDLREEEWKLDVPTIGHVYRMAASVVYYFSGLGLPFSFGTDDLKSKRCWFNRAWTLQETSNNRMVGGVTDGTLSRSGTMQLDNDGHHAEERQTLYRKLGCFRNLGSGQSDIFHALAQMQDRVSQNLVDKVAGLAFLLESGTIPAYYETQSVEDAWTALVNTMQKSCRTKLLFLYPNPGNGDKAWRPTWEQVMAEDVLSISTKNLTSTGCDDLRWDDKTNVDTYNGHWIVSGYVRGLAVGDPEGRLRRGELIVRNRLGKRYTIQIVATHQFPIPQGSYALLASRGPSLYHVEGHWVVGKIRALGMDHWEFEKLSVFQIPDESEMERLSDKRILRWSSITLT